MKLTELVRGIPLLKHLNLDVEKGVVSYADMRVVVVPSTMFVALREAIEEIFGPSIVDIIMRGAGKHVGERMHEVMERAGTDMGNEDRIFADLANFMTLSGWGKFVYKEGVLEGRGLVDPRTQKPFLHGLVKSILGKTGSKDAKVVVEEEDGVLRVRIGGP